MNSFIYLFVLKSQPGIVIPGRYFFVLCVIMTQPSTTRALTQRQNRVNWSIGFMPIWLSSSKTKGTKHWCCLVTGFSACLSELKGKTGNLISFYVTIVIMLCSTDNDAYDGFFGHLLSLLLIQFWRKMNKATANSKSPKTSVYYLY